MSISYSSSTYKTVNSETEVLVPFGSVSHVNSGKSESGESVTCWIHFHSGKCVHVKESFEVVSNDLMQYLESM